MEKFNFEKEIPESEVPKEKLEETREAKEEISPEYILYHNAIHLELQKGCAIDFFAPKSGTTKITNEVFEKTAQQIIETQSLIKSNKLSEIKRLLIDTDDVRYGDERRKKIVKDLDKLLKEEDLPELKKLLNESGDILKLKWLIENQLGIEDTPIDPSKLRKLKEIRDQSYFLTKEDESFRGWDLVSFDIRKLLGYGFEIYEANNEAADQLAQGFWNMYAIQTYLNSLRKINSPEDCLNYTKKMEDDYEGCSSYIVYKPYCPEYLILPPKPEFIAELIERKKDDLSKIASKYKIIPPYHEQFDYENKFARLVTEEIKGCKDVNIEDLDPKNPEDYQLIVNMLFNDSIINIKEAKES